MFEIVESQLISSQRTSPNLKLGPLKSGSNPTPEFAYATALFGEKFAIRIYIKNFDDSMMDQYLLYAISQTNPDDHHGTYRKEFGNLYLIPSSGLVYFDLDISVGQFTEPFDIRLYDITSQSRIKDIYIGIDYLILCGQAITYAEKARDFVTLNFMYILLTYAYYYARRYNTSATEIEELLGDNKFDINKVSINKIDVDHFIIEINSIGQRKIELPLAKIVSRRSDYQGYLFNGGSFQYNEQFILYIYFYIDSDKVAEMGGEEWLQQLKIKYESPKLGIQLRDLEIIRRFEEPEYNDWAIEVKITNSIQNFDCEYLLYLIEPHDTIENFMGLYGENVLYYISDTATSTTNEKIKNFFKSLIAYYVAAQQYLQVKNLS